MACRATPGNSAVTTYARLRSGIDDVQTVSLFHTLRSEGVASGATPPTAAEWRAFVNRVDQEVRLDTDLSDARKTSIRARLTRALAQDVPDGRTYYALTHMQQRSVAVHEALNAHFQAIASRFSTTPERVKSTFEAIATRNRDAAPEERHNPPENLQYDPANIPEDRASRYALAVLHRAGPDRVEQGREAEVRALLGRESNRCASCGEFTGRSGAHMCSPISPEPVAAPSGAPATVDAPATPEELVARLLANREPDGQDTPYSALPENVFMVPQGRTVADQREFDRFTDAVQREAGWLPEYGRPASAIVPSTRLATDAGSIITGRIETQQTILEQMGHVQFPVRLNVPGTSTLVLGSVRIDAATADEPPRSRYNLRCTCDDYRSTYDCEHVRGAAVEVNRAMFETPDREPSAADLANDAEAAQIRDELARPGTDASAEEDLDRRIERRRRRAAAAAAAASVAETPRRRRTPLRRYASETGAAVQMQNVSQVRRDLTGIDPYNDTVDLDVVVVVPPTVDPDTGERHGPYQTVTGSMRAITTANGRRTRAQAMTDRYEIRRDMIGEGAERTLRCDCAEYRERYDCAHIRQACEEVQSRLNDRDAVAVVPEQSVAEVAAQLRSEYDDSVAGIRAAREQFGATESVSYAENMEAFQGAWDAAKARINGGDNTLDYMTENATGGLGAREGGRSFGIEIEIDFPEDTTYTAKQRVAEQIHAAGLAPSPQVHGWHHAGRVRGVRGQVLGGGYSDNPNNWNVEFDRSVDDVGGARGCEIVSPIMYDEPQTWQNIATIMDIVERNGGKATPRTGLHVNVGSADYDHTVENHNTLLQLSSGYEDVLIRTSHNPQSAPQHRGRNFCQPSEVPAQGFRRIGQAQQANHHRAMVNMQHTPAEGEEVRTSTRIEVRMFDGSTDKGRVQANIKVALGLVNAGVRGAQVPDAAEREPAGTHRTRNMAAGNGRMRRLQGEAWEADTASFRSLADTLFSRDEDKAQFTHLFASSKWQAR